MRPEEAQWIGKSLAKFDLSHCTIINVGSSTARFRETTQPHIEREIFTPLRNQGARVIHCDMKADEGVDMVGDLLDPAFRGEIEGLKPDFVLANNLFEHVRDRGILAECLAALPGEGGRLLISVPYAYPYHADPIDTMYRPTPGEIAGMFPGFRLEDEAIVTSTSLWRDLVITLGPTGAIVNVGRRLGRLLFPFFRPRAWLATASTLMWLGRLRSVSIVSLVRERPSPSSEFSPR